MSYNTQIVILFLISEIEKKKHVIGIFIDLSKAFDTIEHGIILDKLSSIMVSWETSTLNKKLYILQNTAN